MKVLREIEGYRYYNGDVIAREVYMPDDADETVWKKITEEEAKQIEEEQERKMQEEMEREQEHMFDVPEEEIEKETED